MTSFEVSNNFRVARPLPEIGKNLQPNYHNHDMLVQNPETDCRIETIYLIIFLPIQVSLVKFEREESKK